MASFGVLNLLLRLLLLLPNVSVLGDMKSIKTTCKSTNYYDLCVSSLTSNSSSLKADTRGLATIMIGIGMVNATGTCSYLSSQLLAKTNDTLMKKVLKECADKYSHANEALQASLQELDSMSFDFANVELSAAKDYPNSCHNAYRRFPGLTYPVELARRQEALQHICDVALGIINLIEW